VIKKLFFIAFILVKFSLFAEPQVYNQRDNVYSIFSIYYDKIMINKLFVKNKIGFNDFLPFESLMLYYLLSEKFSLSNTIQIFLVPSVIIGAIPFCSNSSTLWYKYNHRWIFYNNFDLFITSNRSIGTEFGFMYKSKIFSQPSYMSIGYSLNYQLRNKIDDEKELIRYELRYEFSTLFLNRFRIIYQGNYQNYIAERDYHGLIQNGINVEFIIRKFSQKAKRWSLGMFWEHTIYNHQEDVIYNDKSENIFNRGKELYYDITIGLYFIF